MTFDPAQVNFTALILTACIILWGVLAVIGLIYVIARIVRRRRS